MTIELANCPQAIHGRFEVTPSGKCPWCEWEGAEMLIERLKVQAAVPHEAFDNPANMILPIRVLLGLVPVSETATAFPEGLCGDLNPKAERCVFTKNHIGGKHSWQM